MSGSAVLVKSILSENELIDLNDLPVGIYYAEVDNALRKWIIKLVKK